MFTSIEVVDWILLLFLMISAVSVAFIENLLVNVIIMCSFSMTTAVIYLVINAPDVAITEAAVGAGFSTVLMLIVLYKLGWNYRTRTSGVKYNFGEITKKIFAGIAAIGTFLCLAYAVTDLPEFGDATSPANAAAADSYISDTYEYTGVPNLVTAILASFRGYDTLCETIVVFTAAMCVSMIIGRSCKKA